MVLLIDPALVAVIATAFTGALLLYVLLGILFFVWFLRTGARILDPGTEGSPKSFWWLIFPGVVALWPVLWRKVKRAKSNEV